MGSVNVEDLSDRRRTRTIEQGLTKLGGLNELLRLSTNQQSGNANATLPLPMAADAVSAPLTLTAIALRSKAKAGSKGLDVLLCTSRGVSICTIEALIYNTLMGFVLPFNYKPVARSRLSFKARVYFCQFRCYHSIRTVKYPSLGRQKHRYHKAGHSSWRHAREQEDSV